MQSPPLRGPGAHNHWITGSLDHWITGFSAKERSRWRSNGGRACERYGEYPLVPPLIGPRL
eukprot:629602-Prorocentrum_minimum.AAC.1